MLRVRARLSVHTPYGCPMRGHQESWSCPARNGRLARVGDRDSRAGASEELPELVAIYSGVAQDPGESAALEFTMKRNHERNGVLVVFEAHMTAALANGDPPHLFKRADQLLARDDWQPLAHAGSGSVRLTIPISIERPSSRRPST